MIIQSREAEPLTWEGAEPSATIPITGVNEGGPLQILTTPMQLRPGTWRHQLSRAASNPALVRLDLNLNMIALENGGLLTVSNFSLMGLAWHLRGSLEVTPSGSYNTPGPLYSLGIQQLLWFPGGAQRIRGEGRPTYIDMPGPSGVPIRYDIENASGMPVDTWIPFPGPWRAYDLAGATASQIVTAAAPGVMTPIAAGDGGDPLRIPDGATWSIRQLAML